MKQEELINQTERLIKKVTEDNYNGMYAEVREFFRVYGGTNNIFFTSFEERKYQYESYPSGFIKSILESFLDYLRSHKKITCEFFKTDLDSIAVQVNRVIPLR